MRSLFVGPKSAVTREEIMNLNISVKHVEGVLWALVALCLILAATVTDRSILGVIAIVWIISMAVVIPLHFLKAWRRLPTMCNKSQYAAWVGFETACVLALIGVFVYDLVYVYRGTAVVR